MSLNLSEENAAEYARRYKANEEVKQQAIAAGNAPAAKRARQAQSYLYQEFAAKQLPPEPPTEWEIEESMTLEQRVDRIERLLNIGRYAS